MALKGKPVAIGNTATTIYTCPASKEAAVHGLLFGNNTASALAVDVVIYNQAAGSDVTVVTDLAVPANGIATWSKPINLNAGDAVKAVSSAATGMVCLYSTYEDGATPVASGFTARGAWSSAATYVANDIVSVSGTGTYVAIQGSTNQNPTTATAYWMFLEGISASALPAQSGNAGKYLTTDGSTASWGTVDVGGGATVTTMTADLTLTSASNRYHKIICNTADLDINLPNATSLNKGESFHIIGYNGSPVTIKDSTGGTVTVLKDGSKASLQLFDNSTAAGTWTCENTSMQAGYTKAGTLDLGIVASSVNNKAALAEVADNIVVAVTTEDPSNLKFTAVNATTLTKGTATFHDASGHTGSLVLNSYICKLDTNKFACLYYRHDGGSTYIPYVVVGSVDASLNITLGSGYSLGSDFYNTNDPYAQFIVNAGTDKFIMGSTVRPSTAWLFRLRAGSVSGTTVTFGNRVDGALNNHVSGFCLKRNDNEFWVYETNGGSATTTVGKFALSETTLTRTNITNTTTLQQGTANNFHVSMDSSNSRHAIIESDQLYLAEWDGSKYEVVGGRIPVSNFGSSSGGGIVRLNDTTVGLFGDASGGLAGSGTSFRTATWNSSSQTWLIGAISLLENSNVMSNFTAGSYVDGRNHAIATADGSILYIGKNSEANYFVGKVGTTVVG